MRQIPLAIGAAAQRSFDTFLPGGNAQVLAHVRELPLRPTPLYLWSPAGSGKTHLLQALAAMVQAQGGRVAWFDADSATPWEFDSGAALIVFDDCDRYDAARQQAAFALFVEATAHAIPIAAAARVPPVDLVMRDDLRTRLAWGHVFALEPLGEVDARAALRREADRRAIFLSDDVMDYLLTRFARDLKHLMQLLDRLDEFSLATKRPITVPLLKRMLDEEGQP
ncbi:MAG: DnaA regulatory inactivator Hda [Proteobacteria bacterium]|nr:DnaA regulatory inactivator Hda [Pseudomonadota bacterium]